MSIQLAELLAETIDVTGIEARDNERISDTRQAVLVRLDSPGLSVKETTAKLRWLGLERSNGTVWAWTHRLAEEQSDPPPQPTRVKVDETAIPVSGEWR